MRRNGDCKESDERNQSRKTNRVQVAEGPRNHVEFDLLIFLRPIGGD